MIVVFAPRAKFQRYFYRLQCFELVFEWIGGLIVLSLPIEELRIEPLLEAHGDFLRSDSYFLICTA